MNELILAVAKERILPGQIGVNDYPNPFLETQLYRLAVFIAQDILDTYLQFAPWGFDENSTLDLALRRNFPREWLKVAKTSTHYYLQLKKVIAPYRLKLTEESVTEIQKIIEFLCYEIIETTVIRSNFQPIAELSPQWIRVGTNYDPVLRRIIREHQLVIAHHPKIHSEQLVVHGIEVSNKAQKLIRIFMEEYISRVFQCRADRHTLTIQDVEKYFNNV